MPIWIIYALASAWLLALTSLIDRLTVSRKIKYPVYYFGISSASAGLIFMLAGLFLIDGFILTDPNIYLRGILIGLILSAAILVYLYALKKEPASTLAPIFSLVPLFVLIISIIFLGAKSTPAMYLGYFLIIIGLIILSNPSLKKIKLKSALILALLATLLFALANISIDFALNKNIIASLFFWIGIGRLIAALVFSLYFFKKINDRSLTILSYTGFAGALGALSFVFFALSANHKTIVHASMLSETYPLLIIIFILIFNKIKNKPIEKIKSKSFISKIIATVFIILGTLLIS